MNCHATINARQPGRIHGSARQYSRCGLALLLCCALLPCANAAAQAGCPAATQVAVTRGWTQYRDGAVTQARTSFAAALEACPRDNGAAVGMAYVEIREGSLSAARRRLDSVIARDSSNVDALTGRGIIAWREGQLPLVTRLFARVQKLDPDNADAREYLARAPMPDTAVAKRAAPRSDTTEYPARINGDNFEIRSASGWTPFYVKGMNLGAALPGKYPSEFPDSSTYASWLADIAKMGVNTLRVYTIHPRAFYDALLQYNDAHRDTPLWLIHGVWTELPPRSDFDNAKWKSEFFGEMQHVADVIHGHADIAARPGHASGHYRSEVSRWVLGYIIGREWEPHAIQQFNTMSTRRSWNGAYLDMPNGTAAEAWMAEASEHIVAYEMKTYNAQRPVAYTNWPTLDPLTHPTETTVKQELAIRKNRGETVIEIPKEYNNDESKLDAALVSPTAAFPAGWFASYHAYPYYPDFMLYDRNYVGARSSEGVSNYFGYLTALKRHHGNTAVLISEYGVPTGMGVAHVQPQGWHHGGVTEHEMAAIDARMTREIAEAGMAGGMLFAWIDEWFKKNWIVIDHEIPLDRTRMWHNRLDAEQHYGMVAIDAKPAIAGATMKERQRGWQTISPLYQGSGASLRIASDASYLWLRYDPAPGTVENDVMIGFDVVDPIRGDTRWPGLAGPTIPVGLEFVLRIRNDSAHVLADQQANPWRIQSLASSAGGSEVSMTLPAEGVSFHTAAVEMLLNRDVGSARNADGVYTQLLVYPNRRRFTTDGAEIKAIGYDRGLLRAGDVPDGAWQRDDAGAIEVRVPWTLINVTDPSQRRVLDNLGARANATELKTSQIAGIRIAARIRNNSGDVITWPEDGRPGSVKAYTWQTWNQPEWTARMRSVYTVMQAVFAALAPASVR